MDYLSYLFYLFWPSNEKEKYKIVFRFEILEDDRDGFQLKFIKFCTHNFMKQNGSNANGNGTNLN